MQNSVKILLTIAATMALHAPAMAEDKQDQEAAPADAVQTANPKKITDRNHPDYIRCRTEDIIGSRAKKRRICLTNRQWADVNQKGNQLAREMADDNTSRPAGQ